MKQQNWESMDFEEMMQKAVNAEAKAGLKSSTMVQNSDTRCPRGNCPSHNTSSKVQTQSSSHKDSPRSKEPKPKDPKPAPSHDNGWNRLKKRARKIRRKISKTKSGSILVSKPRPLASTPRPQKRKSRPDASTVIKKATMQMSAPNLQNTSVGLSNLRAGDW